MKPPSSQPNPHEEITDPRIEDVFAAHQKGDYEYAEQSYRFILNRNPNNLDALQLLGALLIQQNRYEEALAILTQAVAVNSNTAATFANIGVAYSRLNRRCEAVEAYRRSIEINPHDCDVHVNLGRLLAKMGRYAESANAFESAVRLSPDDPKKLLSLSVARFRSGDKSSALEVAGRTLLLEPENAQALRVRGQCLLAMNDPESLRLSVECWRRIANQEPENPDILSNLASALRRNRQWDECESVCKTILQLFPNHFHALCNLGLTQSSQEKFELALATLRLADELARTTRPEKDIPAESRFQGRMNEEQWGELVCTIRSQLASLLNLFGEYDLAQNLVDEVLVIDPTHVNARMMQGFLHLQAGKFQEGWSWYEERKKGEFAPRSFPRPEWMGEENQNATVLLHSEQGLGDTLQFVRYARLVRERVGRVLLLVPPSLKPLLLCSDMDAIILAEGEPIPAFDFHLPMMSLPFVFQTSISTVPNQIPYISADSVLVHSWGRRLRELDGFKIGIAWQGNREFAFDSLRRLKLEYFRGLASIPGVRLVSLQNGVEAQRVAEVDFEVVCFEDLDCNKGAFMDSAAILQNLDLVISPCTAIAHLAGAMGRPIWFAKSFAAEWRWMIGDHPDNPWYPTMRMYRQPKLGEWSTVFESMKCDLSQRLLSREHCFSNTNAIANLYHQ